MTMIGSGKEKDPAVKSKGLEAAREVLQRIQEKGAFLLVQAGNRKNVMTIGAALFGMVWRRPMMMVAVRKTRFTFGLIEEAKDFAVSVPAGEMGEALHFCGSRSGRDIDKFRECGLVTVPAARIETPRLMIPGYHYECRIAYKTAMDPRSMAKEIESRYPAQDYHTLYFGEILACQLAE